MRIAGLDETQLLVPLHDGMFEQPKWRTFLERLRQICNAEFSAILLRSAQENDNIRYNLTSGTWPVEFAGLAVRWRGRYGAMHDAMKEGRVYTLSEVVESLPTLEADICGLNKAFAAMALRNPSGFDATIVLAGGKQIHPSSANLLAALTPHIRVALKTFGHFEIERARAEVRSEAMSRMNFGWISLDQSCRIVDCDPHAERLLAQSGYLTRGPYDRLTPASSIADRQLLSCVRKCSIDSQSPPRAISISHDPWIDMLIAPVHSDSMIASTNAVAVAYVRGDQTSRSGRHDQLRQLFGLTQSEARLAWSVAQGLSIAEAAQANGLTIETARNYSKKIYAKTGTRGQVDLVRHILTSVLILS